MSNHHFTSSIYLLSPVFQQWVNVEAYNFRDVKCLFRTDVFWWWRLSPLSVHLSMMLSIRVGEKLGFLWVLVLSVCGKKKLRIVA